MSVSDEEIYDLMPLWHVFARNEELPEMEGIFPMSAKGREGRGVFFLFHQEHDARKYMELCLEQRVDFDKMGARLHTTWKDINRDLLYTAAFQGLAFDNFLVVREGSDCYVIPKDDFLQLAKKFEAGERGDPPMPTPFPNDNNPED